MTPTLYLHCICLASYHLSWKSLRKILEKSATIVRSCFLRTLCLTPLLSSFPFFVISFLFLVLFPSSEGDISNKLGKNPRMRCLLNISTCLVVLSTVRNLAVLEFRISSVLLFIIFCFVFSLACQCADIARDKGYKVFGLQFYGECWSSPNGLNTFNQFGTANYTRCIMDWDSGTQTKTICVGEPEDDCIGVEDTNYVYELGKSTKEVYTSHMYT